MRDAVPSVQRLGFVSFRPAVRSRATVSALPTDHRFVAESDKRPMPPVGIGSLGTLLA